MHVFHLASGTHTLLPVSSSSLLDLLCRELLLPPASPRGRPQASVSSLLVIFICSLSLAGLTHCHLCKCHLHALLLTWQGASDGPSQATYPMPALCPHPPQTRTVCHHPRLGTELPQPQVVPAGQPGIFSSCPFSPTTHPSRQETLLALLAESVQSLTTPLSCTATTPARATPSLPELFQQPPPWSPGYHSYPEQPACPQQSGQSELLHLLVRSAHSSAQNPPISPQVFRR